jgi:selenocysteine-specific elongation factor
MTARARDLVLGTAGHIDHGKTALVRALTGVDTDRLPAEKERGITIDLGFAALDLGDQQLAVVDVPGHERFIRNMLAGASGLDLAMLVVAADDSVMPQTREHLEILRLLGLERGIVAITKCDLAGPDWLGMVEDDIRTLLDGTFLQGAPIVRTSVITGEGLDRLRDELHRLCESAPERDDPGLFRMAIDRVFTRQGHGTIVTGTVASGSVRVGEELEWLPAGRAVRVRGLQQHSRSVERVGRGARAAINVVGVHHAEVHRGQELGSPGYLSAGRVLSVQIQASPTATFPIRHRRRYRVHLGTAEITASLALFGCNELLPGASGLGQLFLTEPVAAVYGQPFVIRDESPPATLGGGRILQPTARRIRRRDARAIEGLSRLQSTDSTLRVATALAFQGLAAWTEPALCRMTGLSQASVRQELATLSACGAVVELPLGPRRCTRLPVDLAADLEDRVVRALGRLHASHPRQSTIPRAHLAVALPGIDNEALISGLVERLIARGDVIGDARSLALRGFEPKLSQGERRLKGELAEAIRAGGFSPPDSADLAATAGSRAQVLPELLKLLRDEERLVEVGSGLYLDYDVEADLRRRVSERLSDGSTMTMSELRDLLGTTRKYAVPIGEYLDRIGFTRRVGDARTLNQRLASVTSPSSETRPESPPEGSTAPEGV